QQHTHPVGWLVLVADAVHNFIGGMFVGAAFITDTFLGVAAWLASAAHEVPQELGDFGVLLHAGWEKRRALLYNFISALTFPLGGVVAYFLSGDMDVSFLIPFAAGNFIYIAAVDLVPEVRNSASPKGAWRHWAWFFVGLLILLLLKLLLEP
ncbi:MAG: ZIP family metal transporter, partial [Deltaproteobacteria bacterium]|nr:ZIP family metal transporter [Deltaproteobacteria bacterium]